MPVTSLVTSDWLPGAPTTVAHLMGATLCDAKPMGAGVEGHGACCVTGPRPSCLYLNHSSQFLAQEFHVDL